MYGLTRLSGGYLSMQSSHAPLSAMSPVTSHTQLLHLNPDPNVTMSTLSPTLSLPLASMYDSTYHRLLADVFPHLCSVILAGSTSSSSSPRLFFTASITAVPPGCRQKCSTPFLKSIFGAPSPPAITFFPGDGEVEERSLRHRRRAAKRASSETGRTRGARRRRLTAKARTAALGSDLLRLIPTRPSSSSRCVAHACASSFAPMCARTRQPSSILARRRRAGSLVSITAAPPLRNRQLASIIDLSVPEYQLGAMDSDDTTSATDAPRRDRSAFRARSSATSPALQPIPHGDVEDEHVDVEWVDAGLGEELGDGGVEEGVHLAERVAEGGGVLAAVEDAERGVGVLADAGADDHAEEEAVVGEAEALVALDHVAGRLGGDLPAVAGLVADVVEEVAARPPAASGGGPGEVGQGVRQEEHPKLVNTLSCQLVGSVVGYQ
nr:unnamed protein product [Digitaria exilis]